MLGEGSELAAECFANNFIGTDYEINQDLSGRLYKSKRDFNRELIPIYMAQNPGKSKIGAGQAMECFGQSRKVFSLETWCCVQTVAAITTLER